MPAFQINGCNVEVARKGRGEPVILLHASGASGVQWRDLADQLADRYQTFAPDLYGYGGTAAWPGYGEFSLADEAALVLGLMDTLPGPAHLVAHSYGAAVALQVARARPR
ncbi:MAG TPA: alpha/beta fold hydrolase, partial [Ramlibacter sp.]|nr:alpha/beta fold hydrolase [Ramlibacter sp.]